MGKIKTWWRKLPIPIAFVMCSLAFILLALFLTNLTVQFAGKNMQEIQQNYLVSEIPMEITEDIPDMESQAQENTSEEMEWQLPKEFFSDADRQKYDSYEKLEDIAAIFWYSICICLAALVFYLWKIKKPFQILNQATQKIANHDLNFQIHYNGQDEFGRLCHTFEVMREELVRNEKRLWNSIEERKRLNAAFSHDLKTPLTVLQGHTDMLLSDLPDGSLTKEEMLESVRTISKQISRIHAYVNTMNSIQRLEDYEIHPVKVSTETLEKMVSETAKMLFIKGRTEILNHLSDNELSLDMEAITQICENLLSNAARYAKEKIAIRLEQDKNKLILVIEDDGNGFSQKDLKNASHPYYRGGAVDSGNHLHFGLGLYISSLLARKHGGTLQLENRSGGGAKITVKICCI